MARCELKKYPEYNRCCCVCRWRLEAHRHNAFPKKEQIGWVCVGFAFMEGEPMAYLGDFEHGLCELFKR